MKMVRNFISSLLFIEITIFITYLTIENGDVFQAMAKTIEFNQNIISFLKETIQELF